MGDIKEKSFSDNLKEAKPNSTIKLTATDRANNWWNYEKIINQNNEERLNFLFLFLGLIFGIVGSYISTQIYDFSKGVLLEKISYNSYLFFNIVIWLIFGIILSIFIIKILNVNQKTKELKKLQQQWSTCESIKIGEIYTPEFLEKFNLEMKGRLKKEGLTK
ncbi:MAG: hypothetical protein WCX73_05360 [Candidatus Pacearchaeota archaeon]